MNDLETMQKVILGVFLVTEVYFGDLHYIGSAPFFLVDKL